MNKCICICIDMNMYVFYVNGIVLLKIYSVHQTNRHQHVCTRNCIQYIHTHIHTHILTETHTYIYIYVCMCE